MEKHPKHPAQAKPAQREKTSAEAGQNAAASKIEPRKNEKNVSQNFARPPLTETQKRNAAQATPRILKPETPRQQKPQAAPGKGQAFSGHSQKGNGKSWNAAESRTNQRHSGTYPKKPENLENPKKQDVPKNPNKKTGQQAKAATPSASKSSSSFMENTNLDLRVDEILADVHARRDLFSPEIRFIPPAAFEDAAGFPKNPPSSSAGSSIPGKAEKAKKTGKETTASTENSLSGVSFSPIEKKTGEKSRREYEPEKHKENRASGENQRQPENRGSRDRGIKSAFEALENKEKTKKSELEKTETAADVLHKPFPRQPVVPPAVTGEARRNQPKPQREKSSLLEEAPLYAKAPHLDAHKGKPAADTMPDTKETKNAKNGKNTGTEKRTLRSWFSRRSKDTQTDLLENDPYYGLQLKSIEEYRRQYQETMAFPIIKPEENKKSSPFSYLYTEEDGELPSVFSSRSSQDSSSAQSSRLSYSHIDAENKEENERQNRFSSRLENRLETRSIEKTGEKTGGLKEGISKAGFPEREKERKGKTEKEDIFSFSSETLRKQSARENRLPLPEATEFSPALLKELNSSEEESLVKSFTVSSEAFEEAGIAGEIDSTGITNPLKAEKTEAEKKSSASSYAASPKEIQERLKAAEETAISQIKQEEEPQKAAGNEAFTKPEEPLREIEIERERETEGESAAGREVGKLPPEPVKEPTPPAPKPNPQEASPSVREPESPEAPLRPRVLKLETPKHFSSVSSKPSQETDGKKRQKEIQRKNPPQAVSGKEPKKKGAAFLHGIDFDSSELAYVFRREVSLYLTGKTGEKAHEASHEEPSENKKDHALQQEQKESFKKDSFKTEREDAQAAAAVEKEERNKEKRENTEKGRTTKNTNQEDFFFSSSYSSNSSSSSNSPNSSHSSDASDFPSSEKINKTVSRMPLQKESGGPKEPPKAETQSPDRVRKPTGEDSFSEPKPEPSRNSREEQKTAGSIESREVHITREEKKQTAEAEIKEKTKEETTPKAEKDGSPAPALAFSPESAKPATSEIVKEPLQEEKGQGVKAADAKNMKTAPKEQAAAENQQRHEKQDEKRAEQKKGGEYRSQEPHRGENSKGVPDDILLPFIQPIDPRTREDVPSGVSMRAKGPVPGKNPSVSKGAGAERAKSPSASGSSAISNKQKKKPDPFRMRGTDEPDTPPEEDYERVSRERRSIPILEDYTKPEDAPAIQSELDKTHHTLLIRLMATGIIAFVLIILEIFGNTLLGESFPAVLRLVFYCLFLGVSCLFCIPTLKSGLKGLFTFKGNGNSGAALGALAALLQYVFLLFSPQRLTDSGANELTTYGCLAGLALFLNTGGKLLLVKRMRRMFQFLTDPAPKYGVKRIRDVNKAMQMAQNCVPGVPVIAYQRKTDFLHRFLQHSEEPDPADSIAQILGPAGLISSLILGGAAFYMTKDFVLAVTAFTAGCCAWIPIMNLLAVQFPLFRVARLGKRMGAILTSYTALDSFSDTNAVLIDGKELFPPNTLILNGIRTLGDQRIDTAILDATALTKAVGGSLSDLFGQVIRSQDKILPAAENVLYEDTMGISGWVNGRRTLVGNRAMLEKHGIEPPSTDYEKKYLTGDRSLIYLASGGDLVAMFLITYTASGRVAEELQRLEDHGVSILVRTCDPNVTPSLIAQRFHVEEESIHILPNSLGEPHYQLLNRPDPKGDATLATHGKFTSMARMLVACIRQRGNISMGIALQTVAVILAFLLTAFLVCCSSLHLLTTGAFLLYELFWAFAIYIVPSIRKG